MFLFYSQNIFNSLWMADGKKSFVLYCDLQHTVELMDDALAGRFFKHLLAYVNDDKPQTEDMLLKIAFEPLRQQLKRDLRDWEEKKLSRKDSAALGNIARWHKDIYKQVVEKQLTIEDALALIKSQTSDKDKSHPTESDTIPTIANVAVNATVNVNDNVTKSNGSIPNAATAAVGDEKVKQLANKAWANKLWKEQICMGLTITPGELKKWMAGFNSSIASDTIENFDEARYKRMLRGWIAKQQEKGITVETGISKKSDSAPLTKL